MRSDLSPCSARTNHAATRLAVETSPRMRGYAPSGHPPAVALWQRSRAHSKAIEDGYQQYLPGTDSFLATGKFILSPGKAEMKLTINPREMIATNQATKQRHRCARTLVSFRASRIHAACSLMTEVIISLFLVTSVTKNLLLNGIFDNSPIDSATSRLLAARIPSPCTNEEIMQDLREVCTGFVGGTREAKQQWTKANGTTKSPTLPSQSPDGTHPLSGSTRICGR